MSKLFATRIDVTCDRAEQKSPRSGACRRSTPLPAPHCRSPPMPARRSASAPPSLPSTLRFGGILSLGQCPAADLLPCADPVSRRHAPGPVETEDAGQPLLPLRRLPRRSPGHGKAVISSYMIATRNPAETRHRDRDHLVLSCRASRAPRGRRRLSHPARHLDHADQRHRLPEQASYILVAGFRLLDAGAQGPQPRFQIAAPHRSARHGRHAGRHGIPRA